ncbi:MAG: hypothetical protein N2170_00745 [Bacteroidia bacterium]|nr:hypothetical protein [Bacteroidia bacterium]
MEGVAAVELARRSFFVEHHTPAIEVKQSRLGSSERIIWIAPQRQFPLPFLIGNLKGE